MHAPLPDLLTPRPAAELDAPSALLSCGLRPCNAQEGIVSVAVRSPGVVRVWRRTTSGDLTTEDHAFPQWFLTRSLDLLSHLSIQWLSPADLGQQLVAWEPRREPSVVPLQTREDDALRFLVLTDDLPGLEAVMLDVHNKRTSRTAARTLLDLRPQVHVWSPVEQYLILTGQTYFGGLAYDDLYRLQFDLETTGLDEHRDRIFMVSLRDSRGWRECLDTSTMSEAELIQQLCQIVQTHDPDVLENHNIFGFDLPFLARRSSRLGVTLALGRDGSEPYPVQESFWTDVSHEPFKRWVVPGREVLDTLQSVKRYGARIPEMRRYGLKEVARYFGFASASREYVPGPEIWTTFLRDPARVRRYAGDDVQEVDSLSQFLHPFLVELTRLVPRSLQQIAVDARPQALWEPLLARAYLHAGHGLPAPLQPFNPPEASRRVVFSPGPATHVETIAVTGLSASVFAQGRYQPRGDELDVHRTLLAEMRAEATDGDPPGVAALASVAAREELAATSVAALGLRGGLLPDPHVATLVADESQRVMDSVVEELTQHGATPLEMDGARITFAVPQDWATRAPQVETHLAALLPPGARLRQEGRYLAAYFPSPSRGLLLAEDGSLTIVGDLLRLAGRERLAERFIRQTAPFLLRGELANLSQSVADLAQLIRSYQVPVEDLCLQATLYKSPRDYQADPRHDPVYELMLESGFRSWRTGQRIRYVHARTGLRLVREDQPVDVHDLDVDYYVHLICSAYARPYANALTPEEFALVFPPES